MTREEFGKVLAGLVSAVADARTLSGVDAAERAASEVMAAWDAQAAEVARLRAEVEALRGDGGTDVAALRAQEFLLRAHVERLRAEVEALRTGVPLTAENAPRAWVIRDNTGEVHVPASARSCWVTSRGYVESTGNLIELGGATVLAWRK